VRFICVGSGPQQILDKFKEQAKNLGLGQNILWAGPRTNMPAVFNTFNLSVSSSAYGEGFPNVVAEAMACGVPCVSTKIGDAQDIVADTGVIVPPHDHQALAAAILQILNLSVEKRKLMGTLARQRIIANFSLEKMAYEYTNLYRHLARLQKDQKPE
jgi:glycosyltransferase involved in cell wall biosynthesis